MYPLEFISKAVCKLDFSWLTNYIKYLGVQTITDYCALWVNRLADLAQAQLILTRVTQACAVTLFRLGDASSSVTFARYIQFTFTR